MLDPAGVALTSQTQLFQDATFYVGVTRCVHVAAYSLFVYDWLLCLEDEIELLLQKTVTIRGKVLYAFARIWPLVSYPVVMYVQMSNHDPGLCEDLYRVPMYLTVLNLAGAASILILRTYAFTGGNKHVLAFLGLGLIICMGFQIYATAAQTALIPIPVGCYPVDKGDAKFLSGYFLTSLLFDCVVTGTFLMFIHLKLRSNWTTMTGFTKLFVGEGFAYFIAISAVNTINTIFNYQSNFLMSTVAVPMSLLLPNLLACRLVINLRRSRKTNGDSLHPLSIDSSSGNMTFMHVSSHEQTTVIALDDMQRDGRYYHRTRS